MGRFKNYGLWISVAALVRLVIVNVMHFDPANFDTYVQAVLIVLVAAGIISNPKEGKWYPDTSAATVDTVVQTAVSSTPAAETTTQAAAVSTPAVETTAPVSDATSTEQPKQ